MCIVKESGTATNKNKNAINGKYLFVKFQCFLDEKKENIAHQFKIELSENVLSFNGVPISLLACHYIVFL